MIRRCPPWLKKKYIHSPVAIQTARILTENLADTVCQSSRCPNQNECFSNNFATFLIMGRSCTRSCAFCSIKDKTPLAPDPDESLKIVRAVKALGLKHVIITSVTRDDISDGGASCFVECVRAIREQLGRVNIELLIPDMRGNPDSLAKITFSGANIIGHNMETVKRLYPIVRPVGDYQASLGVLRFIESLNPGIVTKSGIMVGLGETDDEVFESIDDIRETGCDMITIGQYLSPGPENITIDRFVDPDVFELYSARARMAGFRGISCGPFVRSSYFAQELFTKI